MATTSSQPRSYTPSEAMNDNYCWVAPTDQALDGLAVTLEANYISSSACSGRLIHYFQVLSSALAKIGPAGTTPRPRIVVVVDGVIFDSSASQQVVAERVFDVSHCRALRTTFRDAAILARQAPTNVLDALVEQLPFVDLIRCIAAVFRPEHSSTEPTTPVYAVVGTALRRGALRGGSPRAGDSDAVLECELDSGALLSPQADDRRSVADLRQKSMLIDEMRLSHAAQVARLQREMQNEKEASLLEMVRLHSEKEQLLERLAVLEFRLSSASSGADGYGNGLKSISKPAAYLVGPDDVSSTASWVAAGGKSGGRMEVSTVSSGLPPAVGLQYWTAYTTEAERQRAIPQ